jgi:hypothetical protein
MVRHWVYAAIRERNSEVKKRIERISECKDRNRATTSENNRIANGNRSRVEEVKHLIGQVREVIKAKEQELERPQGQDLQVWGAS